MRARGVEVRLADYDRTQTLGSAFGGVDRLLLISSNEMGRRVEQHSRVVEAAKSEGVRFIAYTSVLKADTSLLGVAAEHRQTEREIEASGVPFAILRNGWYTENYADSIPFALAENVLSGSAGAGRISAAARADYAEAAAAVLESEEPGSGFHELAGDEAFTLAEFAAAISTAAGRTISYRDMPEAEYARLLRSAGLPDRIAALLADSDAGAARGGLHHAGGELSRLIGRPTTSYRKTVSDVVSQIESEFGSRKSGRGHERSD